jgi:ketol-acid reductoisomerase
MLEELILRRLFNMKKNFGGVEEDVVTVDEFPLEKAREVLRGDTIAVVGYGVQGPAQAMNMKDNGLNVIVGQDPKFKKDWDKAVADGWVLGKTLFPVGEAVQRGSVIQYLVSDAAQKAIWESSVKPNLKEGDALYFSHGFSIVFGDQTGVVPPDGVDVIMVAPKGAGSSVRTNFLNKSGINSSYAVHQNHTGNALERTLALGVGIGSGYLFPTTFQNEVLSDLTGERAILLGELWAIAEASYYSYLQNGHSPREAFINSSEQLTQVILPLIGEHGAKAIYEQARKQGELGTLKKYQDAARNAAAPIMDMLYRSVASGDETAVVLRKNSRKDYAEQLRTELDTVEGSEMWRAGAELRATAEDRTYNNEITDFGLAGVVLGDMEAQYDRLLKQGHSPSEAFNETIEELTQSLNPIYQKSGAAALIGKCSSTAQRGALDWGPVFLRAHLPVFMGLGYDYSEIDFNPADNYTAVEGPNIWDVGEVVRSLRPENRKR